MKMPLTTYQMTYATSVEGGAEFTEEELEAAGLSRSDVHVDHDRLSQMDIDNSSPAPASQSSATEVGNIETGQKSVDTSLDFCTHLIDGKYEYRR